MSSKFHFISPIDALKQAIGTVYPDRTDITELKFEGTLAQAWHAFARLLAIRQAALSTAIAPIFGVQDAGPLDPLDPKVLALFPFNFCQQNAVLPLRLEKGQLVVATANPFDENVRERARFLAGIAIRWVLAPPNIVEEAIVMAYAREATRLANDDKTSGTMGIDENAVVKLGRAMFDQAISLRASDLHIQPFLGAFVVRVRVDGVLRRLTMLPDPVATSLIRHLKARSGMESTNATVPQDGRMSLVHEGHDFDLRVSSLPASRGERLVIRFLDQSKVHRLSLSNFSHAVMQSLRRAMELPSGLLIMTGPTGSGKTTTLYGMLAELNRSTINIITVENPVEYRIPGISQVDVNEKSGRTFHATLRSVLRQDPDVILIGEIRDAETAEIACQAALTGHLVLTTLHTNDALTAIPRLLNLGIEPSILADSLALIVAQRLCRSLCPHCKVTVSDPLLPDEQAFIDLTHNRPGHRAVGCKRCDYTGYHGRLPVVDIIEMSKGLRDAIACGESRLVELDKLRETGLRSLAVSGSLRIISGDTTVAEVVNAVGPGMWSEIARHYGTVFSSDSIDLLPKRVFAGQSVLIIGQDEALAGQIAPQLKEIGLRLIFVRNAEEAHAQLKQDEDITFIIGDLPDDDTLPQAIERLSHNRLHISWARLPSLVFLPRSLAGAEDALRESGVMGAFMAKPLDHRSVLEHIRHAHAR